MTAAPTRRIAALSAALALPLALLSATPAAAATVGVTTWSDLKAAFLVDGDTVRLDADITAPANESLAIDPNESITLDLNGFTLEITDPGDGNAAIAVPPTSTLTINATGGGTLTPTGGTFAAGIGGGDGGGEGGDDGGTTTINGGTINATGGPGGAGIGGGGFGDGGTTTINGGTITATGGTFAAGIGGGEGGSGGTTTINGGTVTATGGNTGAGIGAGSIGTPGVLEVNGTPDTGTATNGGNPRAADISNPTMPPGVGYAATTSTVSGGGRIELRFTYLITFAANGGSTTASQTISDGDPLTEPAPPTREGFTFAGWTVGGSTYDFTTPVTEPLELTATWTAVPTDTTPPDDAAELADTGADVTASLGIATLLLAGGITLIALRRRPTAHSA